MSKKKIVIAVVAVIIILAAGAGFWKWKSVKKEDIIERKTENVERIEQVNQWQANVDTNNWKTYTNEKYEFELKYPEYLITEEIKQPLGAGTLFALNIVDENFAPANGGLFYTITIKKTNFKNIDSWYVDWKKRYEKKPLVIEGGALYDKVVSEQDLLISGIDAKKYILGGYPFSDTCESFIKTGLLYEFCYFSGARMEDYEYAKIGDDGYGNNKYNEEKLKEIRDKYRKLLDDIVLSIKFKE